MRAPESTGARFPLATWAQVRAEVVARLRDLPGARRRGLIAVLLLAAGAGANVMVPRLLGVVVDIVTAGDGAGGLVRVALWLAVAAVVAAVLQAGGFFLVSREVERVIAALRGRMVGTALGLPVHEVEAAGSGDLVSRSTDDVAELSAAVSETVPILSRSVFMIAATVVALAGLDWQFLLVPLVALPFYWIAGKRYLARAPRRYAEERASMADRARRVLEAIHGRETVRAYGTEDRVHGRIGKASARVVETGLSARTTMLTLQTWVTFCEFLLLATALTVGFHLARTDVLSVGAVTAAVLMLVRLRGPLLMFMRVLDTVQSAYASLARIVGVVVEAPEPVADSCAPVRGGTARLEDVTFTYPGTDGPAVRDVSLELAAGEALAVVGASGAGKTTVAALLAGLRVPDSGRALIDGVDVAGLSDAERVRRLALISQDVHVFSGTLRDDLTLARPDAADGALEDVLARVGARWYRDLPDGLDTEVGARGEQLDPVAAQQLALARVLLLDPEIVVMDEATAEAGSAGAEALEAAAAEVTRGRSAVVIAHRLDQAARADRVLVMDDGRVVESGPHAELVAAGGAYARLWDAWSRGRT